MKKIYGLLIGVILSIVACTKHEQPKPQIGSLQDSNLPSWVLDPSVPGTISAVGIAPTSTGGMKVQIAQAEVDARANIAARIQTEVSRISKDSLRKANVDKSEQYEALFEQATKEVIRDFPVTGAVRKNIYKDPSDGTLYIQMAISQAEVEQYLTNTAKVFANAMAQKGASRKAIDDTTQAMKGLFDELDLERSKSKDQVK